VRASSRFTSYEDPDLEAYVSTCMSLITAEILQSVGHSRVRSIVLAGSFGKGQGSVCTLPNGLIIPLGDFDIHVITRDTQVSPEPFLKAKEKIMKQLLPSEYAPLFDVDISFSSATDLDRLSSNISVYELKVASRILYGENFLNRIPLDASSIAISSGVVTLFNRMRELMKATDIVEKPEKNFYERAYINYQCVKVFLEIVSAFCLLWSTYASSFLDRAILFEKLVRSKPLGTVKKNFRKLARKAVEAAKLKCYYATMYDLPTEELWIQAYQAVSEFFPIFINMWTGRAIEPSKPQLLVDELTDILTKNFFTPYVCYALHRKFRISIPQKLKWIIGFLANWGDGVQALLSQPNEKDDDVPLKVTFLKSASSLLQAYVLTTLLFYAMSSIAQPSLEIGFSDDHIKIAMRLLSKLNPSLQLSGHISSRRRWAILRNEVIRILQWSFRTTHYF